MATEEKNGFAKVKGVLQGNSDIREEILRHIYWKDKTYTDYGEGLLRYADSKNREAAPLTNGKGLLEYTHDGASPLSEEVRRKYGTGNAEVFEIYPYQQDYHKWVGDYRDVFNVHNRLGEVGDIKYAEGMTFANYANSDRYIEQKYLTPSLIGFYGSNPSIDGAHKFITAFNNIKGQYNPDGGRMSDIPEVEKIKIVHDITSDENAENNGGYYYLEKQIFGKENEGKYNPTDAYHTTDSNIESFKNDGLTYKHYEQQRYIDADSRQRYDEGDVVGSSKTLVNEEGYKIITGFTGESLLTKTNDLFKKHKISTLIGRFHTSSEISRYTTLTDSAKTTFGNSHGRNLLKKDLTNINTNGYENPYCRVWTYHHQYDRVEKLIRPFIAEGGKSAELKDIQKMNDKIRSHGQLDSGADLLNGGEYLANNTVLNRNGAVNIAPSSGVNIKKCMFSIENLAWKDVVKKDEYLSKEQQGPNGGRIMWFPPYDLDFQENVNVDWDGNSFIGRGERVYTYKNTDRTGTLSFTMLIDHPGVIDLVNKYGISGNNNEDVEDSNDILRFFAGCQQLELSNKTNVPNDKPEENSNTDEGKIVPSKDNVRHIKFYVYFPNNYSGNHLKTTKQFWNENGPSDDDWLKYLLYGSGTGVDEEEFTWLNGYEMSDFPLSGSTSGSTGPIYPNPTIGDCTQWKERKEIAENKGPYHYRVDFDLRQVLKYDKNYVDTESYHLNSKLDESVSKGANYSFAEVVIALLEFDGLNMTNFGFDDADYEALKYYIIEEGGACEDKINELISIFAGISSVTSIKVKGAATLQDSKPRPGCEYTDNELLAKRRAKTAYKMVEQMLLNRVGKKAENAEISYSEIEQIERLKDMTDINTKEAKAQRYAVVEIELNNPEAKKVSDSDSTDNVSAATNNEAALDNTSNSDEAADTVEKKSSDIPNGSVAMDKIVSGISRYETEAEYFEKLKTTDSFIYKTLKEKFKYFTPAFHSMSPEGFNARLNFLHQCTRQGHTIEASDKNGYSQTAGNLSFGRMPVCVLRIGDFLNTRILINSLSINYGSDGMQWDLNPEGAGVQPMYAKISMAITIIGGQSLTGPINRLQNAVSFDYYANTGVYDDRADRIAIAAKDDGTVKETYTHLWLPHPNEEPKKQTEKVNK